MVVGGIWRIDRCKLKPGIATPKFPARFVWQGGADAPLCDKPLVASGYQLGDADPQRNGKTLGCRNVEVIVICDGHILIVAIKLKVIARLGPEQANSRKENDKE